MESYLTSLADADLKQIYEEFNSILPDTTDKEAREDFITVLKEEFKNSDNEQTGRIDRTNFEKLIGRYFECNGISPSVENYDIYFKKIATDNNPYISFEEYVKFLDD